MDIEVSKELGEKLNRLAEQFSVNHQELLSRLIEIRSDEMFFMNKWRKRKASDKPLDLRKVGILGCQAIARGIVKLMAVKGIHVIILGDSEAHLNMTMKLLQRNLDWMISKWELTETEKKLILQHISTTTDIVDLAGIDLVFDTTRSLLDDRIKVYQELDKTISDETIICINDETCSLSDLHKLISRPERLIGCHFTYPASRRKIVEVMRGLYTSDETRSRVQQVMEYLGKEVIEILESPGAITSRIMMPYINEAIGLWIEGVASADEIDRTMKLAMNLQMGPLEFADTLGLDTVLNTLDALYHKYGFAQFRPHARLRHLVRIGLLGKKTGQGILHYDENQIGEAQ